MANKGQATQADIAAGLENMGSVDSLVAHPKGVNRDSPFRNTSDPEKKSKTNFRYQPESDSSALVQNTHENAMTPIAETRAEKAAPNLSSSYSGNAETRLTKAQRFDVRLTLPVDEQMKDDCDALAKRLQRLRTDKGERITGNTVFRCLIRAGIRKFKLSPGEYANCEEELLQLMLRKF